MEMNRIYRLLTLAILSVGVVVGLGSCNDDEQIVPTLSVGNNTGDAKVDTMRLISYNILEAMKLDKANNYDNFVAWVSEQAPDILALEEANYLTQEKLEAMAARWGHQYVVTNIKSDDNYPVALTSKYPINVVQKITDKVSHGAIHATINGINIVVLHLWPQAYAPTSSSYSGYSATAVDGDAYRVEEINRFLDMTIRATPQERNWLMMGDFNSSSPLDAADYSGTRNYDVHTEILASGYYDCLRHMHSYFIRSTPTVYGGWVEGSSIGGARIDFIYGSRTMMPDITRSEVIMDEFTNTHSDHYPCLVEFRHYTK